MRGRIAGCVLGLAVSACAAPPRVVLISLDGAKPDYVERYLQSGVLERDGGLGRLRTHGVVARQNVTATPSVTAVSHIAIATGSGAVRNAIPGNSFHPIVASVGTGISGFAAPIGGYHWHGPGAAGEAAAPTALPIWTQLRRGGRKVVTATWPGSDGSDILIAGQRVQAASARTSDWTVPYGAFGGLAARGFQKTAADFVAVDATLSAQLRAAGHASYSPGRMSAQPLEIVYCAPGRVGACAPAMFPGAVTIAIGAVALDATDDGVVNYDTLLFYDTARGVASGPFALPSTGPAVARAGGSSAPFLLEGSGAAVATAWFVSRLAADLSTVRFARYAAYFVPRNPAVAAVVDDVHRHVGPWGAQPDPRIVQRLAPGFDAFPDAELEAMYLDQVASFIDYQTRLGLRAIERNPDADLVMIYLQQPDGAGHQFTLTDPRQASEVRDNRSVGSPGDPAGAIGQDPARRARYAGYLEQAYRQVNRAVQRIVDAVGVDGRGAPVADVLVVSDHGMAPFHTAVGLRSLLAGAGVDVRALDLRVSGPSTNIYVNLVGRQAPAAASGTVAVAAAEYPALVRRIAEVLRAARDPNPFYDPAAAPVFSHVWTRPTDCERLGRCTSAFIGQDFGDVFALMREGYSFDGIQNPLVPRLGDAPASAATVFSVPGFHGTHGHDARLPSMSAILYAAGPRIARGATLDAVSNLDVAPTVMRILGVAPAATVEGRVIPGILRDGPR